MLRSTASFTHYGQCLFQDKVWLFSVIQDGHYDGTVTGIIILVVEFNCYAIIGFFGNQDKHIMYHILLDSQNTSSSLSLLSLLLLSLLLLILLFYPKFTNEGIRTLVKNLHNIKFSSIISIKIIDNNISQTYI